MDKPGGREIQEAIDRILSRREFGGAGEELAPLFEQSAAQSLPPLRDSGGSTGLPLLVMVLVVGALVVLAVFLVARTERNRRLGGEPDRRPRKQAAPPDPLREAVAYAARGEYQGAIVCLFALHLRNLQGQGWIALEKSKTNLQYEFELMQSGYPDLAGFRAFKDLFNGVRYGGYGVEQAAYEQWLAYCRNQTPGRRSA